MMQKPPEQDDTVSGDDDYDIDSWKTCVLLLIYIRNSYAPEEAKLIESGALTTNRTVTTANITTI